MLSIRRRTGVLVAGVRQLQRLPVSSSQTIVAAHPTAAASHSSSVAIRSILPSPHTQQHSCPIHTSAAITSAAPKLSTFTSATRKSAADGRKLEQLGFNPYGYKLAIFGRPNVGKSTLFNRLIGRHVAIVDAKPGVTRDRTEGDASIGELEFRLVDTAGLEEVQKFLAKDKHEYRLINNEPMKRDLQESILMQTQAALEECDIALFVIDGREGVTSLDRHFAKWLRKQCTTIVKSVDADGQIVRQTLKKPVILLANKCDHAEHEESYVGLTEGFELGFGAPVAISADHSGGMSDLHNAIYSAMLSVHSAKEAEWPERERRMNEQARKLEQTHQIKLAIVGKVNAGKSTLLNTLLGKKRVLTGDQPGVTRDAVEVEWKDEKEEKRERKRQLQEWKEQEEDRRLKEAGFEKSDQKALTTISKEELKAATESLPAYQFTLIDTAGLKGTNPSTHTQYGRVDAESMRTSLRQVERANVVAMVVDIKEAGLEGVEKDGHKKEKKLTPKQKRAAEHRASLPQPLSPEPAAAAKSIPLTESPNFSSGILFRPGKTYSEEERSVLLRTYVRNVFTSTDLAICSKILLEGKALIILLNKFDSVTSHEVREQILEGVQMELADALTLAGGGVTVLGISGSNSYDSLRGQPLKTTIAPGGHQGLREVEQENHHE